jgi:hypothetical protein
MSEFGPKIMASATDLIEKSKLASSAAGAKAIGACFTAGIAGLMLGVIGGSTHIALQKIVYPIIGKVLKKGLDFLGVKIDIQQWVTKTFEQLF